MVARLGGRPELQVAAGRGRIALDQPEGYAVRPFGQFLIGGIFNSFSVDDDDTDFDGTSHFMLMPGVGAVFAAGGAWGFVGQLDLQRVFLDEDDSFDSRRNDIRVFLGVRLSIR